MGEGFSADEDEDLSTLPIGPQLGFILEPTPLQTLPGAPPCALDAASSLLAKFKSKVPTSICTIVDGSACVELADLRSGHRFREPLGTRSRNPEASGSELFERDPEPPCKKKRLIPNRETRYRMCRSLLVI
jgi:hypothetical protein